jgi:hypothetical protein
LMKPPLAPAVPATMPASPIKASPSGTLRT